MLRIAVIGNTYKETYDYIKWKFENKIAKFNTTTGVHYLTNGDELHMCYREASQEIYYSAEYDAYILTPDYRTLFDVIRYRSSKTR